MGTESTPTYTALCNSLIQQYYTLVAPVHKIKDAFVTQLNQLQTTLSEMAFSNLTDLQSTLGALSTQTLNSVPGATSDDINQIQDFMSGCDCYYDIAEMEQSAVSAVLATTPGVYSQLNISLGEVSYPEFTAGIIANNLNNLLGGISIGVPGGGNISAILSQADCMITCMGGLCPGSSGDIQNMSDDLDQLYTDLQIDSDPNSSTYGQINYSDIYSNAGMTDSDILNMQTVIDGIGSIQQEASVSISNSVGAIKIAIKGGLF